MNNNQKKLIRILCLALAGIMILGVAYVALISILL